jgi:hypothetical protein
MPFSQRRGKVEKREEVESPGKQKNVPEEAAALLR